MEAVTDVVFRHVIKQAGPPDVFFTEFTNATGWAHAGDRAIGGRLIRTEDEAPIVAQLWGSSPDAMAALSQHCATLGYHGIDLNMGCPDASAVKTGGGAGMIRTPELAREMIAAAKTSGLPVSVKTRLGYSRTDEMTDWLSELLRQDITALTVHLRTKKEMSKVPAHYELIDDIVGLRDTIAPNTLLVINGDIRDRAHGLELIAEHPGVDGVMIGRGVFHDPFCFRKTEELESLEVRKSKSDTEALVNLSPASLTPSPDASLETDDAGEIMVGKSQNETGQTKQNQLIDLLRLHLDLYDQYHEQTSRPYETLKRFYKIYIRDFDGASDLRHELMQTNSTDEVRAILATISS